MKIFEFEGGQKLKVTNADYDLLQRVSGMRFTLVGAKAKPLIDQIRDSIKIGDSNYITGIIGSSSEESIAVVNRLVLNQLLKFVSMLNLHPNEIDL